MNKLIRNPIGAPLIVENNELGHAIASQSIAAPRRAAAAPSLLTFQISHFVNRHPWSLALLQRPVRTLAAKRYKKS